GERYLSAGDLAVAAHEALTVPEQLQEASILRQGHNANGLAGAVNVDRGRLWANYVGGERQNSQTYQVGAAHRPLSGSARLLAPLQPGSAADSWPPAGTRTQLPGGGVGFGQPSNPSVSSGANLRRRSTDFAVQPSRPRNKRKLWSILGAAAVLLVAVSVA